VVLMATLPVLMVLARIDLRLALGVSISLYLATQFLGLTLPSYPTDYGWFLNPFAWQLLFTLGFASGTMLRAGDPVPYHRVAYAVALGYVAFSAVWTLSGWWLASDTLPLPAFLWQIDKTNLSLPRLLHLIALAYVIAYMPWSAALKRIRNENPLVLIGRHPLPLFCTGIMLSMTALIIRHRYGDGIGLGTLLVAVGVAIQIALAVILEWYSRASGARRTLAEPQPLFEPQPSAEPRPDRAVPGTAQVGITPP